MKFVQKLVQLHLRPIVLAQDIVTDSAARRLLFEAGDDIEALMMLCHADVTTKMSLKEKYRQNFELVKQKLKDVEERDKVRNWQPPISGEDIMILFDLAPGRTVGQLKNLIREAILGRYSKFEVEAYQFLVKKAGEMNLTIKPRNPIGISNS
jgi:hypothetical protein